MRKTLDTTSHLYTPAQAEALAARLQASDPDWRYVPVHDPKDTGYSYITVVDEDGEFIGKM
jgi:hypothetical protein